MKNALVSSGVWAIWLAVHPEPTALSAVNSLAKTVSNTVSNRRTSYSHWRKLVGRVLESLCLMVCF